MARPSARESARRSQERAHSRCWRSAGSTRVDHLDGLRHALVGRSCEWIVEDAREHTLPISVERLKSFGLDSLQHGEIAALKGREDLPNVLPVGSIEQRIEIPRIARAGEPGQGLPPGRDEGGIVADRLETVPAGLISLLDMRLNVPCRPRAGIGRERRVLAPADPKAPRGGGDPVSAVRTRRHGTRCEARTGVPRPGSWPRPSPRSSPSSATSDARSDTRERGPTRCCCRRPGHDRCRTAPCRSRTP